VAFQALPKAAVAGHQLVVGDDADALEDPSQIPQAQMIKRFRELRMPLNEIRQLLASPDGSLTDIVSNERTGSDICRRPPR
jgi:hypothetical protein